MLSAFKIKLAAAAFSGLAGPLAAAPWLTTSPAADPTAFVEIQPGAMTYRVAGDFTRDGKIAGAPLIDHRVERPFAIMARQVSGAEYQACVDDGGCRALPRTVAVAHDRPVVQVSWRDADAYAAWLSRRTGQNYRLPTDAEWAFAAGSRFKDDGLPSDANDPSKRWIARYEAESGREQFAAGAEPQPFGSFGANEKGISDLAGNVWEWTASCFVRTAFDAEGRVAATRDNCGVRVVQGQHRAYVTDFIRDARAGGCAAGVPPTNLGFRLVRDVPTWTDRVAGRLLHRQLGGRAAS